MAVVTKKVETEATPSLSLRDRWRSMAGPALFMGPAVVLTVVFFFLPVFVLFFISMTNMSSATGLRNYDLSGFENYVKVLTHPNMPTILGATIFYVLVTLIFFNVGLALLIALLSTHIPRRAGFFYRTLWLLPRLTPSVVYIMMWKFIAADAPYGILNTHVIEPLGIEPRNWLPVQPWAFVILTNGFIGASFGMIIFTSAIESIPRDYMVAALVDGCNIWQRIRYVILPALRWPLLFVTTYQTLSLLTSFEQILLLTDGQFGTEVWSLWSYHRALNNYFGNFQWGFGAALAMVLVVIGVVAAVVYMRYFQFDELIQEPRIEAL